MRPPVIAGHVWRVVRVLPGDPSLVDRTGMPKLATSDPGTRTISLSTSIPPEMFDKVYLHELAHAVMYEHGVTELLSGVFDAEARVLVEELLAWFLEAHSIEVITAASMSVGRGVCIEGRCI